MKKIATLTDNDIYPGKPAPENIAYEERVTGKVILINEKNMIGLVGNNKNSFLQLPGGGIEAGEDLESGAARECLEETGYSAEIISEVGRIDDFRSRDKKNCISYCFLAKAAGDFTGYSHTKNEVEIGMFTKWVSVKEARLVFRAQEKDLKDGKVSFYNTGFNIVRDLLFLEEAIRTGKLHE